MSCCDAPFSELLVTASLSPPPPSAQPRGTFSAQALVAVGKHLWAVQFAPVSESPAHFAQMFLPQCPTRFLLTHHPSYWMDPTICRSWLFSSASKHKAVHFVSWSYSSWIFGFLPIFPVCSARTAPSNCRSVLLHPCI